MPTALQTTCPPAALLLARLLPAALFLHEGFAKLGNYAGAVRYGEAFGVPGVLMPGAIAVELGCGVALVLGLFTRTAALLLAMFCVATAVIFHTKFGETNQLLHFEKNFALAGALLALAVAGPGPWSVSDLKSATSARE